MSDSVDRSGKPWDRQETLAAFNLYLQTPPKYIRDNTQGVKDLAKRLGRSSGSVKAKMFNLSILNPSTATYGLSHHSKLDRQIWDEYLADTAEMGLRFLKSEENTEGQGEPDQVGENRSNTEYISSQKVRAGQDFFRRVVLAAYDEKCCITGLAVPKLLNASHIVPWAANKRERLNPSNGLCLNALHDRAFDRGIVTVTPDLRVKVSDDLKDGDAVSAFLRNYDGREIEESERFRPSREFLEYHSSKVFESWRRS